MARRGWRGWTGAAGRAWEKGAVEVGAVAVAASLLVGAVAGQGLASVALDVADGLTWLPDNASGQVVEVNPSTGTPQARLQLGGPGSDLQINQRDGRLLVTDAHHRPGQLDQPRHPPGQRPARRPPPGATPSSWWARVASTSSTSTRAACVGSTPSPSPTWAASCGSASSPTRSSTAVARSGSPRWTAGSSRPAGRTPPTGSSASRTTRSRAADPAPGWWRTRAASRPSARTAGSSSRSAPTPTSPWRCPTCAATSRPPRSPRRPWSPRPPPDIGRVVLLSGGKAHELGVADLGCSAPQKPTVFGGKVYVPCGGAGRVLVLGPDGRRAAPDIVTADRQTPTLVVDDGRLVVSTPGAATGVVVDPGGATHSIKLKDDTVPVRQVDTPPPPPVIPPVPPALVQPTPTPPRRGPRTPPGPPPPTSRAVRPAPATARQRPGNSQGNGQAHGPGIGTGTPSGSPSGSTGSPGRGPAAVTAVVATARSNGEVTVVWTPGPAAVDGYTVTPVGGGVSTSAPGDATTRPGHRPAGGARRCPSSSPRSRAARPPPPAPATR